jgi:transposase InsO family protein
VTGHRRRLRAALAALDARRDRCDEPHQARRSLEGRIKRAVVGCHRWARRVGLSTIQVVSAFGLSGRTLRRWYATAPQAPMARGRPSRQLGLEAQQVMRMAIMLHGAYPGVTTLQRWCPAASRRALTIWLRQYRRAQRRGLLVVTWTHVGRVWAMDVSQPPQAIDGSYRYVVHVRDLASHFHLAALPVARATASAIGDLLRALCASHDAPLVLKVDNGSPFVSAALAAWAREAGTIVLHSPSACPRYNGSIEASIGAISTRAHHAAAANGHPDYWTTDDVERARTDANLVRRLQHGVATSAGVRWRTATSITRAERRRFRTQCAAELHARRTEDRVLTRAHRRTAIVRALDRLGYIAMQRRAELVH